MEGAPHAAHPNPRAHSAENLHGPWSGHYRQKAWKALSLKATRLGSSWCRSASPRCPSVSWACALERCGHTRPTDAHPQEACRAPRWLDCEAPIIRLRAGGRAGQLRADSAWAQLTRGTLRIKTPQPRGHRHTYRAQPPSNTDLTWFWIQRNHFLKFYDIYDTIRTFSADCRVAGRSSRPQV